MGQSRNSFEVVNTYLKLLTRLSCTREGRHWLWQGASWVTVLVSSLASCGT